LATGEEVQLLRLDVVMRDRRVAGRDRRLRQRLVLGGERLAAGDLTDRGAVERGEGLGVLEVGQVHVVEGTEHVQLTLRVRGYLGLVQRSPRIPLLTVIAASAALLVVWILAYHVGATEDLDGRVFEAMQTWAYPTGND